MNSFDTEEFFSLSRELEKYHSIFDRLWAFGAPIFSKDVKTAAVYFDSIGNSLEFKINPDYWAVQNNMQKQFIIAHECLHVILYHGFRILKLNSNQRAIANIALDLVVNHSLVNRFGFNRLEVDPNNIYCWTDTVFKDPVPDNKYYEYYYNLLEKSENNPSSEKSENNSSSGNSGSKELGTNYPSLVDDHESLDSFNSPDFENKMKELFSNSSTDQIFDFIKDQTQDLESLAKEAGCSPGNLCKYASMVFVKPKKKWETVIKKWASQYLKDIDEEQWARRNRRLEFMSNDFMIPSNQEVEEYEKDRIKVFFFQDTSGSCSGFIDRFFNAAKSLPVDRFDVKMHCFDTRVFETTLESRKLYGFGGTTFSCIERYIQDYIKKNNEKYPTVFVITDGYGDTVNPQFPKKWHWFIDGSFYLIPKESNKYNLKDFE